MAYLPAFDINTPYGGDQIPAPPITKETVIYSSYTGKPVAVGGVKWGTPGDAPKSHPNYGKDFHVVEYNPVNSSYMVHRTSAPPAKPSNVVVRAPSSGSSSSSYGSSGSSGPHALGSSNYGGYSYGSYPSGVTVHQGGYVTGVTSYGYFN